MYFADKKKLNKKISTDLNLKTIIYIGFFQVLALIPGVSRAGITITAARIFNFDRVDSTKIAFLLSIPALAGASALGFKDILEKDIQFNYLIILGVFFSFLFSFFTIKFFLKYIKNFSMNIFIVYRILVAIILFIIIYN